MLFVMGLTFKEAAYPRMVTYNIRQQRQECNNYLNKLIIMYFVSVTRRMTCS